MRISFSGEAYLALNLVAIPVLVVGLVQGLHVCFIAKIGWHTLVLGFLNPLNLVIPASIAPATPVLNGFGELRRSLVRPSRLNFGQSPSACNATSHGELSCPIIDPGLTIAFRKLYCLSMKNKFMLAYSTLIGLVSVIHSEIPSPASYSLSTAIPHPSRFLRPDHPDGCINNIRQCGASETSDAHYSSPHHQRYWRRPYHCGDGLRRMYPSTFAVTASLTYPKCPSSATTVRIRSLSRQRVSSTSSSSIL